MKRSHIDALVGIANSLEDTIIASDVRPRTEIEDNLWKIYHELTTVVGAIQLDRDEMSGVLE